MLPEAMEYRSARQLIEGSSKLLIIPHANVDPDGLSAALSCFTLFRRLGKECTVICPDTLPESLSFLPGFGKLTQGLTLKRDFIITLLCKNGVAVDSLNYSVEGDSVNIIVTPKSGAFAKEDVSLNEGPLPYDLIVVVDSAELHLLGSVYASNAELFKQVGILNIDHHISNAKFGKVNLLNTQASSATEVLYDWFMAEQDWQQYIDSDMATLLLTGLITDTRSFQNPNTTPRSLEIAAELVERGARQQEIIKQIYKTKPLSTLKIWGRALHNLQVNPQERIAWSTISREELGEMQATSKETHGIIDELLTTIPDMDVFILFTETEENECKASVRSTEAVDVSAVAGRLYGGGGHARAAGFRLKDYPNFPLAALESVQKFIAAMKEEKSGAVAQLPAESQVEQATIPPSQAPQTKVPQIIPEPPQSIDVIQKLSE